MEKKNLTRRRFLGTAAAGTIAAVTSAAIPAVGSIKKDASKLAMLGGQPAVNKSFPWPELHKSIEESLLATYKSRNWYRGERDAMMVKSLEKKLAELNGTNRCVGTGSGTQALHCALYAVGVDAGDEVLVTPYTFISSVNVIILQNALPVFVDIDIDTFQMDPAKMEGKINGYTKAVEPVHIAGLASDMDRINAIAKKHNLSVVEDACQALFTEYKGKKCGTMSDIGCFSFQSSKIVHCGEGGAAIGNDDLLMDKCYSFHTLGVGIRSGTGDRRTWRVAAPKYRMNEFEGAVLTPQLDLLEERVNRRTENAMYLTSKLKDIPGILPQKHYEGQGRATYYLYEFRYKKEHFNDIPLETFNKALNAEGVSTFRQSRRELNKNSVIENTLNSKTFKKIFSKERLKRYREENECPNNAQRCKESIGIWHWALSGTKKDVDDIYIAIEKIYENRDKLT
ncbi:DegT/DnrJ/EryC1/StrS family aminotransferase [candidate division KSB1 bacterium]